MSLANWLLPSHLSKPLVGIPLATQVIKITSPVAVAGATLVAAALFGPLRSRVQHRVDRRFNRARYSAERMLAAFAARLTEDRHHLAGPVLTPVPHQVATQRVQQRMLNGDPHAQPHGAGAGLRVGQEGVLDDQGPRRQARMPRRHPCPRVGPPTSR
jgi:hypothetical protein